MMKGQAAMEFLMTYGVAIVIMLAAFAALSYFGVLNPQDILMDRTVFPAPLGNIDRASVVAGTAGRGTIDVTLMNSVGGRINITAITLTPLDGFVCATTLADAYSTFDGSAFVNFNSVLVDDQDKVNIRVRCDSSGEPVKGRFSADMTLLYIDALSGQEHTLVGSIRARAV
ncbi:MAG: hypothetical protein V1725_05195 [archaeon]